MRSRGVCTELLGLFGGTSRSLAHVSCAFMFPPGVKSVLEPFVFTEDKRKEVRGDIEERVRLLEDGHVLGYFSILFVRTRLDYHREYSTKVVSSRIPLSDAICTLETKDLAVSPSWRLAPLIPCSSVPCLSDSNTDPTIAPSRDRTRHAPQSPCAILSLALYSRRALCSLSPHRSLPDTFIAAHYGAESARGRYLAVMVLGKEWPFGQVELLRRIFGLEEDEL